MCGNTTTFGQLFQSNLIENFSQLSINSNDRKSLPKEGVTSHNMIAHENFHLQQNPPSSSQLTKKLIDSIEGKKPQIKKLHVKKFIKLI
jgi:hypothetical protein